MLLRMLVAITLIVETVTHLRSSEANAYGWLLIVFILASAACLLFGFVTPIVSVLIGVASVALVFSSPAYSIHNLDIVVLSTAIALLGPGAFSIDARMFGRREILISNITRYPKP